MNRSREKVGAPSAPPWVHPARHEAGLVRVLFGFLGAPFAWSMHLAASYFTLAVACPRQWDAIPVALALITVAFAGLAVAAGVVASRLWRQIRKDTGDWSEMLREPGGRTALLMMVGMALTPVFVLIIVLSGLIPFFMPVCAAAMFG